MTHTLVDCDCKAVVHPDGSGVEIEFCDLHWAAPELLEVCRAIYHGSPDEPITNYWSMLESVILKARGAIRRKGTK